MDCLHSWPLNALGARRELSDAVCGERDKVPNSISARNRLVRNKGNLKFGSAFHSLWQTNDSDTVTSVCRALLAMETGTVWILFKLATLPMPFFASVYGQNLVATLSGCLI